MNRPHTSFDCKCPGCREWDSAPPHAHGNGLRCGPCQAWLLQKAARMVFIVRQKMGEAAPDHEVENQAADLMGMTEAEVEAYSSTS